MGERRRDARHEPQPVHVGTGAEAQAQLDQVLKVQPDNQLANNLLQELRLVAGGKQGQ